MIALDVAGCWGAGDVLSRLPTSAANSVAITHAGPRGPTGEVAPATAWAMAIGLLAGLGGLVNSSDVIRPPEAVTAKRASDNAASGRVAFIIQSQNSC
jgi:hypothetical protein